MKNLLARGGVEFLAVFLGIGLSLWIDGNSKKNDLKVQKNEVYGLIEKQTQELIAYSALRLIQYDRQIKRGKILIDQWNTFDRDTLSNKGEFIRDIWYSISNGFYPDFSTYETLMNSGQINLIDFEIIKMLGRLYSSMDDINEVQKKEKEWRDFIENRLMIEHADYFSNYDLPLDLFEFFELTKSDVVIYAHLKSIFSIHRTRRDRVKSFEQDLLTIMDKLSN